VEDEEAAKGVAANLGSSKFPELLQFIQQNVNTGVVPATLYPAPEAPQLPGSFSFVAFFLSYSA
jgi:hypothetical protein